ncbi:MAG: ATP-binding cassette domain-containing protein [Pseudomonadota bacterium]
MADRLTLRGLEVRAGSHALVQGVDLTLEGGEILALVGASGSGKTLTARSLLGLPGPRPGVVAARLEIQVGDTVHRPYEGLAEAMAAGRPGRFWRASRRAFTAVRGHVVGYMAQDARGALDPLWSVERQLREAIALGPAGGSPVEWLLRAGFPRPEEALGLYPHELSGGMAQRVAIALSLARGSRFLIADEPTTGLDPTVQEAILGELRATARAGIGVLLITHDLRIVPRFARRVQIMHAGRTVETMAADALSGAASREVRALLDATARVAGGLL